MRHKLRPLSTTSNQSALQFVRELVVAGKLTPLIDRAYRLNEVPDAFRYLAEARAEARSS